MSLRTRLTALAQAVGADIKSLWSTRALVPVDVAAIGNVPVGAPQAAQFDSPITWYSGRVLLHQQTNTLENGVWLFQGYGAPMVRSETELTFKRGQTIYVSSGDRYGGRQFVSRKNSAVNEDRFFDEFLGDELVKLEQLSEFLPVVAVGGPSINAANPPAPAGWAPYSPAAGDRVLITHGPTPGIWIYQGANVAMARAVDDLGASNPRGKRVAVLDNLTTSSGLYVVYQPGAFFDELVNPFPVGQKSLKAVLTANVNPASPGAVIFNSVERGVDWLDEATGRITPKVPGLYQARCSLVPLNNSTGVGQYWEVDLKKNNNLIDVKWAYAIAAGYRFPMVAEAVAEMNGTTDFFVAERLSNYGNTTVQALSYYTYLEVTYLGPLT